MPAAFGLISLLITVCLILYLMVGMGGGGGYLGNVAQQNKQLKSQVNVLGGFDANRQMLATQSIHAKLVAGGSKPRLVITDVMAGGPMEKRFGLQTNDQVVEIGSLGVDQTIASVDDAMAYLHDAYARGWPIVVLRDGQRLQLPTPQHVAAIAERDRQAAAAATGTTPTPPPTPVTPTTPPAGGADFINDALDQIRVRP